MTTPFISISDSTQYIIFKYSHTQILLKKKIHN